jgi:hypothetical protein
MRGKKKALKLPTLDGKQVNPGEILRSMADLFPILLVNGVSDKNIREQGKKEGLEGFDLDIFVLKTKSGLAGVVKGLMNHMASVVEKAETKK